MRVPQSAQLYRAAVRNLNTTLTAPVERQEARALIAELLGGHVKIRQEGEAVYARLEMDGGVLPPGPEILIAGAPYFGAPQDRGRRNGLRL
jgi:hypothetical protein